MDSSAERDGDHLPRVSRSLAEHHDLEAFIEASDDSDPHEDVIDHDRSVLREEEERERLLTKETPVARLQKVFGARSSDGEPTKLGKNERRRQRRREKRAARRKKRSGGKDDGELMFEMEEGGLKDSGSEASSSSLDLRGHHMGKSMDNKLVCTSFGESHRRLT
jgi:hypothetical protein